ncbi:putative L-galactonate transporter [Pandoraea captiosa]|uniref:Putative L-galactonate transporter n=1 Tax=Pandoraea captiosa TaxID=2508302 RepID=A0A5E4ZLZ7_9BURK|nr:MFS transporter [Pandoraea captiosa]VVE61280.1 putative L-galactonate transporter [Pandoraea captiosa]
MKHSEQGKEAATPTGEAIVATGLLALAFSFSFMDRQILPLLLEPVRAAFAMSDTEIGMLQGLAFSGFYACAGIPLGWMVDRYRRFSIAGVCVFVWGLATAACGLCANYGQLLVARTVTAVGEAGCSPASYSLLSDMLSGRRLLRATAFYNAGPYIGGGMALILGSLALHYFAAAGGATVPGVGHLDPWQAVFLAAGLPGLILGVLIFMLREPARRAAGSDETDVSTRATLRVLFGSSQLKLYFAAFLFVTSGFYVLLTWFPSVMIRGGMGTAATIGRPLGSLFLACGLAGCILAQCLVRKLDNRDLLSPLLRRLSAVLAIQLLFIALYAQFNTKDAAYWFYACEVASFAIVTTFMASPIQLAVPNRMRGRVTGMFLLSNNVLGASLGPAAVGMLSDRMKGNPQGLTVAFVTVLGVSAVAATLLMYLSSTRRAHSHWPETLPSDAVARNS